jgi:ATP-dependent exoDNAse (exonuclease V) beta subunit
MSRIEIISASAGSGKTYRLAKALEDAVKTGRARPEAVIATTFTNKAAAELRERVRRRLLEAGRPREDAERLNAALMGTVNSVCGRLVSDFAFHLGLSPKLSVLDEVMAKKALSRARFGVIDEESDRDIGRLQTVFYDWNVESLISRVVELARANGLGPAELAASRDRSLAELDALLDEPVEDAAELEESLHAALAAFLAHCGRGEDPTKKTQDCAERASQFLTGMDSGKAPKWQDWAALAKLDAAKASVDAALPIALLAAEHVRHPLFQEDIRAAVRTVFDLAARALETYSEYKEQRGLIDFVDQECLALRLLDKPEVRAHLEGTLDLVLVDEFQDTSPIQLAIFLKLAEIAKRSVWVGDQKQSIFGFRGSDPELMNAAVDEILKGREPETLPKSYRSRPGLVRTTSELFARAFPRHGIPANRVRLEPSLTDEKEPKGLGPFVERWIPRPDGRSSASKAAALASGIRECLEDPSVMVRDRITGKPRRPRPEDIAVLCRQNKTCVQLADNLARIGVKSALARSGLLSTPEARILLSALRLWSDPEDALSAAEIARMLEHPDDPDRWLAALLAKPGAEAFKDVPVIARIKDASATERPHLGVLASFDRVSEILSIRDLCRRWGNSGERLANLNMLRSLAVDYASLAVKEGAGMTTAGLSAFLAGLGGEEGDPQAFSPDPDAVIISTWHKAKGLEWPIVVLYELDSDFRRLIPDVHVVCDRKRISLADPLADRWIRYWPNPYYSRTKSGYRELMEGHLALVEADGVERRESLRLLYVGWTRARDRVVLPCPAGKLDSGMLGEMKEGTSCEERPLLSEPSKGKADWGGTQIDVLERAPSVLEPRPIRAEAESTYVAEGPIEHPLAAASPDYSDRTWAASEADVLGEPIPLKVPADSMHLGSAIHGFLAADGPDLLLADRLEMAQGLLKRWDVASSLAPEDLIMMSDRLRKWANNRWPDARWCREWPTLQRLPTGSEVHRIADLILMTPDGLVVIDHKAYTGGPEDARQFALDCAEQVQAYADAIGEALGKDGTKMYVHLPLMGAMVRVEGK